MARARSLSRLVVVERHQGVPLGHRAPRRGQHVRPLLQRDSGGVRADDHLKSVLLYNFIADEEESVMGVVGEGGRGGEEEGAISIVAIVSS